MDPSLRASDDDRERVIARLREHCAEGRLSVEEFKERLDAAYAARTLGELALLTRDLPEEGPHPLARPRAPHRRDPSLGAWATASAVSVTVWFIVLIISGSLQGLWPLWVIGPWGVVLLARALTGGSR